MYAHITLFQSHPTQRGNGRARGGGASYQLGQLGGQPSPIGKNTQAGEVYIRLLSNVLEKCKRTMFQEKSAMLSEEDRAWEQSSPRHPSPGLGYCSVLYSNVHHFFISIMSTEICTENSTTSKSTCHISNQDSNSQNVSTLQHVISPVAVGFKIIDLHQFKSYSTGCLF